MTPARCAPWRPAVEEKLLELLNLKSGWNSYNAAPISAGATQRALALLEATMQDDTPAPSVVPLSAGGVQLEWHERGLEIEIEVPPPGRPVECWSIDVSSQRMQEDELDDEHATDWLRRHLAELSSRKRKEDMPTKTMDPRRLAELDERYGRLPAIPVYALPLGSMREPFISSITITTEQYDTLRRDLLAMLEALKAEGESDGIPTSAERPAARSRHARAANN